MNRELTDVFFDLDHTLWDFDRNSGLAFAKIFEIHKITVDYKNFLEVYSPINFQYWKWYREERVTKSQLRYGRLRKTFDKLNIGITDDLINKLSEDYITYLPENNHVFEGTFELLEYLKPKYALHIITNGFEEVQHTKMHRSGLAPYFKTITSSETAGVKKPHPKIFNTALSAAGVEAATSMMIGDTYEADIVGGINMGMRVICFNFHKLQLPEHIITVDRLSQIQQYL